MRLIALGVLSLIACLPPNSGEAQENPNRVMIVRVQPMELTRGVPTKVVVHVEYTLTSLDEGIVQIGFNDRRFNGFAMSDTALVTKGTGRVSVQAEVIPVDWGTRGAFKVFAALGPRRADHGSWMPVARAAALAIRVVP